MSELILHHYDTSPFSEKVKKILAHKGVAWRAVEQPTIMPKPQLVPLTGGYRRIPVLQIGADVYCDSQLIARVLERLHPQPTLYPGGSEGICHAFSLWADRLLLPRHRAGVVRAHRRSGAAGVHRRSQQADGRTRRLRRRAEAGADGARALPRRTRRCSPRSSPTAGRSCSANTFSLADAACYHPVWFLRNFPGAGDVFNEFPALLAWADRVQAMGHGRRAGHGPRRGAAHRQAEPRRDGARRRPARAQPHRARCARRGRARRLRLRPRRGRGRR